MLLVILLIILLSSVLSYPGLRVLSESISDYETGEKLKLAWIKIGVILTLPAIYAWSAASYFCPVSQLHLIYAMLLCYGSFSFAAILLGSKFINRKQSAMILLIITIIPLVATLVFSMFSVCNPEI